MRSAEASRSADGATPVLLSICSFCAAAEVLLQNADKSHIWWQLLNLAAIVVPRNVTLPESTDELQFELRTKGG
ncbi:MAG: hypothetical protein ACKON9_30315, partial [Planctomycetaceae bacterium]